MPRVLKRKYISVVFEERKKSIYKNSEPFYAFSLPKPIIKECDYDTKGPNKGTRDIAEVLKVYFLSIFMCLTINFKLFGRF